MLPGLVRCSSARAKRGARRIVAGVRADEGYFGQPEIQNLGVAACGDENVGRLNVAMNDTFAMRRLQPIRNFDGDIQKALDVDWPIVDQVLERRVRRETP